MTMTDQPLSSLVATFLDPVPGLLLDRVSSTEVRFHMHDAMFEVFGLYERGSRHLECGLDYKFTERIAVGHLWSGKVLCTYDVADLPHLITYLMSERAKTAMQDMNAEFMRRGQALDALDAARDAGRA